MGGRYVIGGGSSRPVADAQGRTYWLSTSQLSIQEGAPATWGGVAGFRYEGWFFDATTQEGLAGTVYFADDVAKVAVDLVWTNGGAGTGDVRWRIAVDSPEEGLSLAGVGPDFTVTATAPATDVRATTRLASGTAVSGLQNFRITRLAADAADTLANDAVLIGVVFTVVEAVPLA